MNTTAFILAFHRGRNPALLALKWTKIKSSPFAFFRGTAPLFYRSWSHENLPPAPHVWMCGDAHIENVGSYKGTNGVAYFDLNDFDEACLAPAHCELGRALTGLMLLQKPKLARRFLGVYREMLLRGKPRHIEPEVARGVVAALLAKVQVRKRRDFLASRTFRGRLRIREGHTFSIDKSTRQRVIKIFQAWVRLQPNPDFFAVKDICGRIAGNGSLGLERFVILVRGEKLPHLIDMKQAAPSAAKQVLTQPQPAWENEAQRVASVQYFMQYVPTAHLGWTATQPTSYILRELQPVEDRVDSTSLTVAGFDDFIEQWAGLVASAHLRSSGWRTSASLDALMQYGQALTAPQQHRLLRAAQRVAHQQLQAFHEFRDQGAKQTGPNG